MMDYRIPGCMVATVTYQGFGGAVGGGARTRLYRNSEKPLFGGWETQAGRLRWPESRPAPHPEGGGFNAIEA